ncbi:MAG: F0F1 ATP synthase subunit A [Armatimonadetes bacterium]|nr:F0F1 ATP synthase subunit A [Armatimonadota bacterium]
MPNESETHDGGHVEHAEEQPEAHEGNLLAHPHPTVLNAYPVALEALAGRWDAPEEQQAGFAERFQLAGQRYLHGHLSPTPLAVLQWAPVNTVATWVMMLTLALVIRLGTRRMQAVPGRLQGIVEWAYQSLNGFTINMVGGKHAAQFTPLLGTFFLYILFLNLGGLVPGFISATAALNTTVALALCCFIAVQYFGFRSQGLGYLKHFVGEPWWLFPINVPIHVLGELARPLSLSIRLFGNIFGEDTVIAALIAMGVVALGTSGWFIPVPMQFPMLLFGIFGSFVQALVFTMLAASYISSVVQEHGH